MRKRIVAAASALLLAAGLLSACGGELPEVYVQSVAQLTGYGSLGGYNVSAGVVVSQNEVKVERDESRKIKELKVEVGQEVAAGESLFSYDMEDMQLTIDKAKLEIEQMKNSVTDLTSQITQLEKERKSAPTSEQLSYTVQIQALETDKKEKEYNIAVKERELKSLQTSASNSDVTAPVGGTIQAINENGGTDNQGMPLPYITIVQSGAYRIKGKVNELNRNDILVGQAVVLRSRVDDSQTWTGTISEIDTENPDTSGISGVYYYGVATDDTTSSSSYPFYIELDSTEGLMLGQHVLIEPAAGAQATTAMQLDASFVQGSAEEGFWVWAEKSGKLEKRTITVGALDEMMNCYEVLDGLTAEDYIAFPEPGLEEGAPTTHTMPVVSDELPDGGDTPVDGGEPPIDGGDMPSDSGEIPVAEGGTEEAADGGSADAG